MYCSILHASWSTQSGLETLLSSLIACRWVGVQTLLLHIDNTYLEQMVGQIYPTELQLNKANSSDTEVPFLDLNLSITNGIVSSKIYDKRSDFNFEIVNFPFLDGDVPRSPSYGVIICQLINSFCKSVF